MLDLDTLLIYLRQPVKTEEMDAVELIVNLTNGLVEGVTGVLNPDITGVQNIRLEVAARAVRNPDNLTSETIDNYTYRREPSRVGVYLTDQEREELVSLTSVNPNPGPWAGSLAYHR